ncbi:MAG: thioredoxin-dependent thiol peroxidase [Alphaproteobacteria bacterium]
MSDLNIGDEAPDFTLPTDGDGEIALSAMRGRKVVLYFYPKDNTPGCTKESCAFNDDLAAFEGMNAQVVGLSKCSVKKHDNFKAKYGLQFPLASDEHGDVCERYGVWQEKSMYGKTFWGIVRSTFLIDEDGKIEDVWRKVKVDGHVEAVRAAVEGDGAG